MNTQNRATKSSRKNRRWMRNPDQLKNPKIYSMKVLRNPDGSFHVIGGNTQVLMRKNQHSLEWVNVDTRDFTRELKSSRITSF